MRRMRTKPVKYLLTVVGLIATTLADSVGAIQSELSKKGAILFPLIEERLNILAIGIILLGGMLFLLNRVRQRADRR